jgi:hypothetical protein
LFDTRVAKVKKAKGLTIFPLLVEQIGAVESVKAASDIYSPVTGQIKSVNDKLGDEPGLLNKSPEENGELLVEE